MKATIIATLLAAVGLFVVQPLANQSNGSGSLKPIPNPIGGSCMGLPPLCMYPQQPICVCDTTGFNCWWACKQ